jgi:SAM-dependent methyltransferase
VTARFLVDFAHVLQILDLHAGMSLVELGCGPGWMTRFAARHGLKAEGYDISPPMIEIARELAEREAPEAIFEVGDMEGLDLGRRFDTCLVYDALHHSRSPDLVLASARRALRPGGRILLVEPNWKHRFQGRDASHEYGVTEMGYWPRQLKRLLHEAGFVDVARFHNNRKRLFGNRPAEIAAHMAEPLVYRVLAPFWTQIWLRATAT